MCDYHSIAWLVCHVGKWGELGRIDALARTLRAGLSKGSTVHILHADGVMLTLRPDFLGHEKPWGSPNKESSEVQLRALLQQIYDGKTVQGATLHWKPERWSYTHQIRAMMEFAVNGCTEVWRLCEEGEQLLCHGTPRTPQRVAGSLLVVLGGVRDMKYKEKEVLAEICQARKLALCTKSLGHTPELTSKCIKYLQVSNELSFLGCGHVANATGAMKPATSPLHAVVYLNNALHEYIQSPAAAHLLVDMFMSSHARCEATSLSLVGKDSKVLTLRDASRQRTVLMPKILGTGSEVDTLGFLAEAYRRQALVYQGLRELILEELQPFRNSLAQLHLLHADGNAPSLNRIAGMNHVCNAAVPVAVVFAPLRLRSEIDGMAADVAAHAHTSIGHWSSSAAFVRIMHNANLMASIIQAESDSCTAKFCKIHERQAVDGSESTASTQDMDIAAAADVCEDSEYEGLDLGINESGCLSALHDFKAARRSFRHAVQEALQHAGAQLQAC
jgi:hypothetical protein